MIDCPNCGAKNPDDADFCKKCRTPLSESVTLRPAPASVATKAVPPGVRIVKPIMPGATGAMPGPTRIPSMGSCYYHQGLLATYMCGRCGRSICRDCAKPHGDMVFCPECYTKAVPPAIPMVLPRGTNWALVALAIALPVTAAVLFIAWWFVAQG